MLENLWRPRLGRVFDRSPRRARPGTRRRAYGLTIQQLEDRLAPAATWTAVGPAPITNGQTGDQPGGAAGGLAVSGRVSGIATDPVNPSIMYIASALGGVWKTTDGGGSWKPLTDNISAPDHARWADRAPAGVHGRHRGKRHAEQPDGSEPPDRVRRHGRCEWRRRLVRGRRDPLFVR